MKGYFNMNEDLLGLLWYFFWGFWLSVVLFLLFLNLISMSQYNRKINWQELGVFEPYSPYFPIDKLLTILIGISLVAVQFFAPQKYSIVIPIIMLFFSFVITIIRAINNNWRYFRGY